MDGDRMAAEDDRAALSPVRRAQVSADDKDPISSLCAQLGPGPFTLVALFASPEADLESLARAAQARCGAASVMGCSTAGEIGAQGYEEGEIVAVALPADVFEARCLMFEDLSALEQPGIVERVFAARGALAAAADPRGMEHGFAFLLVDGLSQREDMLAAAIASGLGAVPLFGGSAGDGTRFRRTRVFCGGTVRGDAAVLAMVRTRCPVEVFSLDHFHPTPTRMVVTEADPSTRRVMSINAAPAARELARILGKDPEQLTPMTFAAHPLVVRLGGQHHVRAIREVDESGALVFFSAIDAGLVLSLAESEDMVAHLDRRLSQLTAPPAGAGPRGAVLACDCILRRLEAAERQQTRAIADVLRRHKVTGFSTYGEQIGARHVNQTMTGVVIHAPAAPPARESAAR